MRKVNQLLIERIQLIRIADKRNSWVVGSNTTVNGDMQTIQIGYMGM